jgi:ABC-2 type transport system ATP-binding protein
MDNQQEALSVENLNVNYGNFKAVQNVSFNVKKGEIFGLLGPNGAGKTSTLSAVEGLLKPVSGAIIVGGHDARDKPLQARASLGVQLQSTSFQPELHVIEVLQLYAGVYGLSLSKNDLLGILKEINLEDQAYKKFGQLSGGQQQRVSLVIATIHNPRLVRIEAIREKGHAVLLTTHSMEEAESVCDRIAIIDHGRVITIDTPQSLIDKHKDDPDVIAVSRRGKVTLEDVFISLTGKAVRS